jgi:hypothetical protein
VQEVRWDNGGTVTEGITIFSTEKETKIIYWKKDFFTPQNSISG